MLPDLTLVLGGACSGKSGFAENLCVQSGLARVYIATAQAFDEEMKNKISRHRQMRGPDWTTLEAPMDAAGALARPSPGQVVLLDCVTLWLSNHLLAESDMDAVGDDLLAALAGCAAPVVVVSNEVGQGIVPDTKLGRAFRTLQGGLNQRLAAQADQVFAVMAGLPLTLKAAPA